MPVSVMAQIGTALRTLLDNNGLSSVRVLGYDHNWDDAAGYPVQLVSPSILNITTHLTLSRFRCNKPVMPLQACSSTAIVATSPSNRPFTRPIPRRRYTSPSARVPTVQIGGLTSRCVLCLESTMLDFSAAYTLRSGIWTSCKRRSLPYIHHLDIDQ